MSWHSNCFNMLLNFLFWNLIQQMMKYLLRARHWCWPRGLKVEKRKRACRTKAAVLEGGDLEWHAAMYTDKGRALRVTVTSKVTWGSACTVGKPLSPRKLASLQVHLQHALFPPQFHSLSSSFSVIRHSEFEEYPLVHVFVLYVSVYVCVHQNM